MIRIFSLIRADSSHESNNEKRPQLHFVLLDIYLSASWKDTQFTLFLLSVRHGLYIIFHCFAFKLQFITKWWRSWNLFILVQSVFNTDNVTVYMCLHVVTCVYIWLHVFTCVYMWLHVFTCVYMWLHVFTCIEGIIPLCGKIIYCKSTINFSINTTIWYMYLLQYNIYNYSSYMFRLLCVIFRH